MHALFTTVTDWPQQAEALRCSRCGVIEVTNERMARVYLRPFARRASQVEVLLWGRFSHRWRRGNRCWLYFRQPRRCPGFLSLDYVISTRAATLATVRGALCLLDEIAQLKGSDAILCDVAAAQISDRALARWHWVPLAPQRWHRRFIKRFYGAYPARDALAERLLASLSAEPEPQLALCR